MSDLPLKYRCSLSLMPSDIKTSYLAQIPYMGQPFALVKAEAEEAGYTIEHWDHDDKDIRSHVHTLQVRPHDTLIIVSEGGVVKQIL